MSYKLILYLKNVFRALNMYFFSVIICRCVCVFFLNKLKFLKKSSKRDLNIKRFFVVENTKK